MCSRRALLTWLLLPCLLALTACGGPEKTEGQRRLHELTSALEGLARQLQESRADLVAAVVDHDALVGLRDPDLLARYHSFVTHLEDSERRQARLQSQDVKVDEAARRYFAVWEQDLALISSDDLRDTSAKRLRKIRRQYEDLHAEVQRVIALFEPLLGDLRDQATYLGVDLNRESLAGLTDELKTMQSQAARLYKAVDEASLATHAFTGAVRG